ncbi:MAG TPA: hypothetical protein VF851_08050 [Steroidobacteraceae bacterium]
MSRTSHGIAVVAMVALLAHGAQAAEQAAAPPQPVQAVWVEHELQFTYQGFTTHYSCTGLRDKVRWILREVGARPDLKVRVTCMELSGPELMPHVSIVAAMPAPATPEMLAGRQAGVPFPARWQTVEFRSASTGRIEDGDCELLEHMRDHVFVPLGIEVGPDSRLACIPHQLPVASVRLEVVALVAVPAPDRQVPPPR